MALSAWVVQYPLCVVIGEVKVRFAQHCDTCVLFVQVLVEQCRLVLVVDCVDPVDIAVHYSQCVVVTN